MKKKNNRSKEKEYLKSLNEEFTANKLQFEAVVNGHRKTELALRKMLGEFDKKKPNTDSLVSYTIDAWDTWTFNPSQSSIESLVSSSSIDLISDQKLRKLLLSWRDILADYKEDEIEAKDYFHSRVLPHLEKNFNFRNWNSDRPSQVKSLSIESENVLRSRVFQIDQILESSNERKSIEETIDLIIELTQEK